MLCLLLLLQLSPDVPKEIAYIYSIWANRPNEDSSNIGYATPVSLHGLITANHLITDGQIFWREGGEVYTATTSWREAKRDLAIAITDEYREGTRRILKPLKFSTKKPDIQDLVFFRAYIMPGVIPTVSRGYVLGIDSDGDLLLDGWMSEGSSGSAVLNTSGEIVGIVKAADNLAQFKQEQISLTDTLRILNIKTFFRGVVVATPLDKIPK